MWWLPDESLFSVEKPLHVSEVSLYAVKMQCHIGPDLDFKSGRKTLPVVRSGARDVASLDLFRLVFQAPVN